MVLPSAINTSIPKCRTCLPLDQRHHIGGVKRVLDVNGVRGGRQGAYRVRAAEFTINACVADEGELVKMGTLQAKCRCGVQPEGLGNGTSCLAWYNPIRISFTTVGVIVHVSVTCVLQPSTSPLPQFSGQANRPLSTPGLSFWLIEKMMRFFVAQVVVQPPKISVNRGGSGMREVEVICTLVLVRRGRACSYPLRCGGPAILRSHNGSAATGSIRLAAADWSFGSGKLRWGPGCNVAPDPVVVSGS